MTEEEYMEQWRAFIRGEIKSINDIEVPDNISPARRVQLINKVMRETYINGKNKE